LSLLIAHDLNDAHRYLEKNILPHQMLIKI